MSLFTDLVIVAFLTPITNYVNNKKCSILEQYGDEEDRKRYASHWVGQTDVYGDFVKSYLGISNKKMINENNNNDLWDSSKDDIQILNILLNSRK